MTQVAVVSRPLAKFNTRAYAIVPEKISYSWPSAFNYCVIGKLWVSRHWAVKTENTFVSKQEFDTTHTIKMLCLAAISKQYSLCIITDDRWSTSYIQCTQSKQHLSVKVRRFVVSHFHRSLRRLLTLTGFPQWVISEVRQTFVLLISQFITPTY